MRTSFFALATVLTVALTACSDDDKKNNGPDEETPQGTGALIVTATLPIRGGSPTFRARKANGDEITLGAPDSLAPFTLPPGDYTLIGDTARAGTFVIGNFVPSTTPAFTITKDQTTTVAVTYALADDGTGRLWVPKYGDNNDLALAGIAVFKEAHEGFSTRWEKTHDRIVLPTGTKPNALAVDAAGHIWVSDAEQGRVMRFSANTLLTQAAPAAEVSIEGLGAIIAIAFDTAGNLYVAGPASVLRFTTAQIASSGLPDAEFADQLSTPAGLAFDAHGNLWVTSYGNDRVVRFAAADLASKTDTASIVVTAKTVNLGAAGNYQSLAAPEGIVFDNAGRMFIANNDGATVVGFDPAPAGSGPTEPVYLIGMDDADCATPVPPAFAGCQPGGLAVGGSGALFINLQTTREVLTYLIAADTFRYDAGDIYARASGANSYPGFGGLVLFNAKP